MNGAKAKARPPMNAPIDDSVSSRTSANAARPLSGGVSSCSAL
jgi:hypothetical protein